MDFTVGLLVFLVEEASEEEVLDCGALEPNIDTDLELGAKR